jgi:hypothetical protein
MKAHHLKSPLLKRIVIFTLFMSTVLLVTCKKPAEGLLSYRSVFDGELSAWTHSLTHFELADFYPDGKLKFEDIDLGNTDSLSSFYSIYKPALSFSPDSTQFIDIYSYEMVLEREGDQVDYYGGDVDQSINLCNVAQNSWKRILFFGPAARIQEATWTDNETIILTGSSENNNGKFEPFIYIGHITSRTFDTYFPADSACIQVNLYESPKLKALHIVNKDK